MGLCFFFGALRAMGASLFFVLSGACVGLSVRCIFARVGVFCVDRLIDYGIDRKLFFPAYIKV